MSDTPRNAAEVLDILSYSSREYWWEWDETAQDPEKAAKAMWSAFPDAKPTPRDINELAALIRADDKRQRDLARDRGHYTDDPY